MQRSRPIAHIIGIIFSLLIVLPQNFSFGQSKCSEIFESPFEIQLSDTKVELTPRVYHVRDLNGWFYFKAKLEDRQVNIKAFLINYNDRVRSSISGSEAFSEMIQHFGTDNIDIIQGRWFPFSVSNFHAFEEARLRGLTMEEAAFETWTGRQAQKHGYKYVEVSIEWVDTRGFDLLNTQNSVDSVKYIKANFYKTKPPERSPIPPSRINRSLPIMK